MPRTPFFCAFCTARFMARRNAMRFTNWSATPCATRAASSSAVLISTMLSCTFWLPVMRVRPVRSSSAFAPLRPMTMPGRAVCTSIRNLSRVRSTSMRLTAPSDKAPIRYSRIFQSSVRYSLYSRVLNQRLFQSVVIPRRKP